MRLTTVCLVRHGETPWNAERRLQGHIDIHLNDRGETQAHATARRLAALSDVRFAAIYSSDLLRARRTAEISSQQLGLAIRLESGLRERHYGAFQGLTYEEARDRYPDDYARFKARDPYHAIPAGGESLSDFARRIAVTLQRIAQRHHGETVLAVTHGGVLDIVHRLATGTSLDAPRNFMIPNAALNWLAFREDNWQLIAWADESHLQDARDELPST